MLFAGQQERLLASNNFHKFTFGDRLNRTNAHTTVLMDIVKVYLASMLAH